MRSAWARALLCFAFCSAVLLLPALRAEAQDESRNYRLLFDARVVPSERVAHVRVVLGTGARYVRRIAFRIDPERHDRFEGDGRVAVEEGRLVWHPPENGGELRYRFRIDHLRDARSYDARCTNTFALFRGDDLVPAAEVRTIKGATSVSRLRLRLPEQWSAATRFPRLTGGDYKVENPERAFDRPTGWIVVGELGVLREDIAGARTVIAAPKLHAMRRQDILALLRFTMPPLKKILGELPPALLVVGAGDPMWRGGLSAPGSIYVHATRPLITEDGTSPLLHEVAHTVFGVKSVSGSEWLAEGIAEYYSIELLYRSGAISKKRYEAVHQRISRRAIRELGSGVRGRSFGVRELRRIDQKLRDGDGPAHSLDDLVRELAPERPALSPDALAALLLERGGVDWTPPAR